MPITGTITQRVDVKEYRKIPRLSYSSLKMYIENRKKFYKKEILGEDVEQDDTDSLTMGNLVDVLLTDEDNFDSHFSVATAEKPSGQLLTFVTEMYKIRKGNPEKPLIELMAEAYDVVKVKNGGKLRDSLAKFAENFEAKGVGYYQELIDGEGRQVVTFDEIEIAHRVIDNLRTSPNTSRIVNLKGSRVREKFPILFEYKGRELKCEIDKFEIIPEKKLIQPYDYKNSAFVEYWVAKYFEHKYYLQAALYRIALRKWADENGMQDYNIGYMEFIVSDSINYYSPLIYSTNADNFEDGVKGFYRNGWYYKGIDEILDNIAVNEEAGNWNISADNILSKGIVSIPSFTKIDNAC